MEHLKIQDMSVDYEPITGFKVNIWSEVLAYLLSSLIEEKSGVNDIYFITNYDEDNGHLEGFEISQELESDEEEKINKALNINIDSDDDFEIGERLGNLSEYFKYILYEYLFGNGNIQTYSSNVYSSSGEVGFTFFLTEDQFKHFKSIK